MNNSIPIEILEKLYQQASENLTDSVVNQTTREKVEAICRCNVNKAPIRFLMSCLLAKIDNPTVDIRKPYTEIEGEDTYSGRFYDERYVELLVHKYKLPCNPTTAYLTPAFRNLDRLLTTDLVLVGRPREVYVNALQILDFIFIKEEKPENVLQEIIRFLLIIKAEDEEFKRRAEEAKQAYWDACKYPRKKKKAIRKRAQFDYSFYLQLSDRVGYNF